MAQKWLGHAQISTTAIYADAIGEEGKNIAGRMCNVTPHRTIGKSQERNKCIPDL
jgi:hypothetical protein